MNNNQLFYIINNNWKIFSTLNEILARIIDDKGNKRIASLSQLKKIEREIKPNFTNRIFKYLQSINLLLTNLNSNDYTSIPELIFSEISTIENSISLLLPKLRSIRLIYKENTIFSRTIKELQQLNDRCQKNLTILLSKWIQLSDYDKNSKQFSIAPKLPYENKPQIWYSFAFLKESKFFLNFEKYPWLKNFKEVDYLIRNLKSSKFVLSEIFTMSDLINQPSIKDKPFRLELFFLLFELKVLKTENLYSKMEKVKKNQIKRQLELFSHDIINQLMSQAAKEYEIGYSGDDDVNPLKEIPRTMLDLLNRKQEEITSEYHGDFHTANQILQEHGKILFEIIDQIELRLKNISNLMNPWPDVLKKSYQMLKQLRGEISRQLEEFEQYSNSIQVDSDKIKLERLSRENITNMEILLKDYQKITAPYIPESIPKIDELKGIIDDFQEKISSMKNDIDNTFNRFRKKGVNITSIKDKWDDDYTVILNRAKFSLKGLIISIFHQFNNVLEKEQEFFDTLNANSLGDNIQKYDSTDFLKPERLSEKDLRNKIQKFNNKILEIEDLKEKYLKEKENLVKILESQLNENGLRSGTCAICRRSVNVAEDNFVKCEFCGALTHYTCVVQWIQHHNSCPVCMNQYTIPNNGLFDPDKLEK
ncbi:RING finger domain-containing protein [Promethearchaeum syntrophicum]|uniref:RING finger domain-containing protein n=1 Tax=Promethearchaeum syntrophicum TaxID=2594042 RepID=A0A5B9DAL9_9ARCH|nr:RING finger protein [Candidatus Prometheoarchaeum syntrophicum]QEE15810.1 hypothetical protein DSAG12_01637 [Candidatus Prometheoarchaeum syntrophicum]